MKKFFGIPFALAIVAAMPVYGEAQTYVYKPGTQPSVHKSEGYVPDAKTAVRIAEAILIPIYGEKQVQSELPLSATLEGGIWIVTGSMPPEIDGWVTAGGVAEVKISKATGEILGVTHGK